MAIRTIETKVYTIDVHPQPEKVFDWIRNNWDDLHESEGRELVYSLETIAKGLGCKVDYCISAYPCQGDFISFRGYEAEDLEAFRRENEPFNHWDYIIIEALEKQHPNEILSVFYKECEYIYSDAYLEDFCLMNEYEFNEDGSIY